MAVEHHPVFARYERWRGPLPSGHAVDFLGNRTRFEFFLTEAPSVAPAAEGAPSLPRFDEEYFEWIDVLEAAEAASDSFTMLELGAGWGRWLVIGAAAARQRSVERRLIGVEAEPSHFGWLEQHLRDNGVRRDEVTLHQAAVAGEDGTVNFHVGDPVAWYGQAIDPNLQPPPSWRGLLAARLRRQQPRKRGVVAVRAISLLTLLERLDRVDLIDLDVQGVEADVLEPARPALDAKVKRVHIGTHSVENEERCRRLFGDLGWVCRNDYASGSTAVTPYGEISFQDGVQTWINPRL